MKFSLFQLLGESYMSRWIIARGIR